VVEGCYIRSHQNAIGRITMSLIRAPLLGCEGGDGSSDDRCL
jgi:hypothetical protein